MNEKKVTVKLDVKAKNTKRKANFAVKALKRQIFKHFKTNNFVIGNDINNLIWGKGKKNAPVNIELLGINKKDKLYLFLPNSEAHKEFLKEQKKSEEKKSKDKKQAKTDVKKAEKATVEKDTKKKTSEKKKWMWD